MVVLRVCVLELMGVVSQSHGVPTKTEKLMKCQRSVSGENSLARELLFMFYFVLRLHIEHRKGGAMRDRQ